MTRDHWDSRPNLQRRVRLVAILVILGISAGLLLLYFLARRMDWALLSGTNPWLVAGILLLTIIGTSLYLLLTMNLIRRNAYHADLFSAYIALTLSIVANYLTPVRAGIPLRVYLYKRLMDIPVSTGASVLTVETIVGVLIPALISLWGIIYLFPDIGWWVPVIAIAVIILFVSSLISPPDFMARILAYARNRYSMLDRVTRLIAESRARLLNQPAQGLVETALLYLLWIFLQVLRLYIIILLFTVPPDLHILLAILCISLTVGHVSMLPMGIGARDASLILLLVTAGIDTEIALAVAIILRLLSPGWPFLLGIISVYMLGTKEISLIQQQINSNNTHDIDRHSADR